MWLTNQVAVVTGAAREIGQQIAFRLAHEGAFVIIADTDEKGSVDTVKEISRRYGRKSKAVVTDITSEDQVINMIDAALNVGNRVEILINNAGIAGPIDNIEDICVDEWEATMAVNLRGMFLCCKHVIPIMKRHNGGSIVNIASITGKRPLPQRIPYATSKMGVIGFTRTLAAEVGKWKIRVNAVCPGSVKGARQKIVFEGIMKFSGKSWNEVVSERTELSPLKTLIDQKYIAGVVAFLCSEDSAMMTGQDINVSAGAVMY
jgi:NAD(P)-dependent dehydrogenase (short-subunit alcohol dehydrogenase family)